MPCRPRHRSSFPRVTAAACCALGLSPDRLPACPVTAGAGRLLLRLSIVRTRLRTVVRLIPLPPHRSQLLPHGPRFPLSVSLRLPRLGQLPFGLPGSEARLPPIGLGLLGASPKLRPGLFGRRDLLLQPGLVRVRRLAGLRHLLLRRPAHPFQLRPGRLSRLPRLPRIGLGLLGVGPKLRPGLFGRRDLLLQPGLVRVRRLAGLRHLLLRRPAHPFQVRPGRLSRFPRPRRVLPGLAGPGLGPGRPGLGAGYRLVPFLPDRSQLLPRGPRLLLSGGLCLPCLPCLPRIGLGPLGLAGPGLGPGRPGFGAGYRLVPFLPDRSQLLPRGPRLLLSGGPRLPCLPRIGLGLLGAGLKPRPGLLSCRDLLVRGPARPVQLRLSRLSPGRPGLRAGYRLVPFPPDRSQLLPRGPRLLLSGGPRLPCLPRIGLGLLGAGLKPRPGLLSCRDLLVRGPARPVQLRLSRLSPGRPGLRAGYRLVPFPPDRSQLLPRGPRLLLSGGPRLPCLPRIGLGLLGAGLKPRPGLLSCRDLLVRGPARPVQLRLSRLSPGRPGLRAGYRLVPFPPDRSQLLPRGPRLLLSGGPRLPCLPRIGLGLLGAGLKPRPGLLSCRDLLVRGPARPVQLRLSRLSPGRPGLRAGYRLVPFLPDRSQLLPRGPRLLLSGGPRLPCLPRIGLGLLGAGLKPRPGLLSCRDLLVRGPARPVQLRLSRLRPPAPAPRRPARPGPGRPGSRTASSRSRRTAASCSRAARASCSAAAFASRALASRASASAAAARASRASASARWRRLQNADPGRPGSPGPADPPPCWADT